MWFRWDELCCLSAAQHAEAHQESFSTDSCKDPQGLVVPDICLAAWEIYTGHCQALLASKTLSGVWNPFNKRYRWEAQTAQAGLMRVVRMRRRGGSHTHKFLLLVCMGKIGHKQGVVALVPCAWWVFPAFLSPGEGWALGCGMSCHSLPLAALLSGVAFGTNWREKTTQIRGNASKPDIFRNLFHIHGHSLCRQEGLGCTATSWRTPVCAGECCLCVPGKDSTHQGGQPTCDQAGEAPTHLQTPVPTCDKLICVLFNTGGDLLPPSPCTAMSVESFLGENPLKMH